MVSPRARSRASQVATQVGAQGRPIVWVTLLSQGDCGLCDQAKAVLMRLQQDPALPVQLEINEFGLDSSEGQTLASGAGVVFAPGVLLDGQPFSHGRLSERKLRKALAERLSAP